MQRKLTATLVAILLLSFGGLALNVALGNTPSLGLDLQGGISVTQQPVGEYDPAAIDLAVERIRDRVDSLGVAEPEIIRQGDAIVVNLPGVKNQQEAIELVQVTGQVYLRPVLGCVGEGGETPTDTSVPADSVPADSVPATDAATTVAPATTAAPGPGRRVASVTPADTVAPDTVAPGTTVAAEATADSVPIEIVTDTGEQPPTDAPLATAVLSDPTQQQVLPLRTGGQCLVGPAAGTGAVFENDARADILGSGGWGVIVGLRQAADGVDLWNSLALQCYNQQQEVCPSGRLAIELDGEIVSAPSVNEPNFTTNVEISGQFSEGEARDLARVLKSGSLPVRMETQSVQNVSPTLGEDSLRAAVISGLIGVFLVMLLLVAFYRSLGLVVVVGVGVSSALIWSVVSILSKSQGLALSLSGVAGIIVSVGVTVDSYVVYFERLKDDIRAGRTLRNSAQRGFKDAWRTVLIADVVSLIGAFTLWFLTVGSVRNFAFFLGLSTLVDLIVSYFFTRPAVLLLARTDWLANRKVLGVDSATNRPSVAGSAS
jgi:preprotein translocase subunit SecD